MSRKGDCSECGNVDHIRGLTVYVDNDVGTEEKCVEVDLCVGARVYSYEIAVRSFAIPLPPILASLHLQDSRIDIRSLGCSIASHDADLPGLAWPAHARLCAAPGSNVVLIISYGACA
jgi:hypothetical protein